jgi:hypothetical protein
MDEVFERDCELRILRAGGVMPPKTCHANCRPVQPTFMGAALSILQMATIAK